MTLSTSWPTLLDIARRLDPGGQIANVAEILNQYNEMLDDVSWVEGNLPTGHKTTLRASIPTATWRLINQGVLPVKSTTKQVVETTGILETRSEIDVDEAMLNGNTAEWRLSEDKPIIEGMGQQLASTLIYGDTSVNPERFVGLAPRYWTVNTSNATTARNVIDAGGTTASNQTSIWLVGWSPETVMGIYPKGSKAGLNFQDLGEQTIINDTTFARMQAYVSRYQMKAGLALRDWRFVVRICNIDITAMLTAGDANDTSANILKYMSMALDKFPPIGNVRPVFYCSQNVRAMLRVKLVSKSNTFLMLEDWKSPGGITRPTLTFQGVPVRRLDAITETESQLT